VHDALIVTKILKRDPPICGQSARRLRTVDFVRIIIYLAYSTVNIITDFVQNLTSYHLG